MDNIERISYLVDKINGLRCSGSDKKKCFVALQKVTGTDRKTVTQKMVTSDFIEEQITNINKFYKGLTK